MTTAKSNLCDDVSSDVEIDVENWLHDCFKSDERVSVTDNELEEISKTDTCGINYLSELLATIITASRRVERSKGEYSPKWVAAMLNHIAVDLQESIKCTIVTSNDTLEELATAESRITELEESVSNAVDDREYSRVVSEINEISDSASVLSDHLAKLYSSI